MNDSNVFCEVEDNRFLERAKVFAVLRPALLCCLPDEQVERRDQGNLHTDDDWTATVDIAWQV